MEVDLDPIGRTWNVTDLKGRCVKDFGNKLTESTIQVNPDSSFSYKVTNRGSLRATYTGNLENKTLKMKASHGAYLEDYEIEKEGKQWTIK